MFRATAALAADDLNEKLCRHRPVVRELTVGEADQVRADFAELDRLNGATADPLATDSEHAEALERAGAEAAAPPSRLEAEAPPIPSARWASQATPTWSRRA